MSHPTLKNIIYQFDQWENKQRQDKKKINPALSIKTFQDLEIQKEQKWKEFVPLVEDFSNFCTFQELVATQKFQRSQNHTTIGKMIFYEIFETSMNKVIDGNRIHDCKNCLNDVIDIIETMNTIKENLEISEIKQNLSSKIISDRQHVRKKMLNQISSIKIGLNSSSKKNIGIEGILTSPIPELLKYKAAGDSDNLVTDKIFENPELSKRVHGILESQSSYFPVIHEMIKNYRNLVQQAENYYVSISSVQDCFELIESVESLDNAFEKKKRLHKSLNHIFFLNSTQFQDALKTSRIQTQESLLDDDFRFENVDPKNKEYREWYHKKLEEDEKIRQQEIAELYKSTKNQKKKKKKKIAFEEINRINEDVIIENNKNNEEIKKKVDLLIEDELETMMLERKVKQEMKIERSKILKKFSDKIDSNYNYDEKYEEQEEAAKKEDASMMMMSHSMNDNKKRNKRRKKRKKKKLKKDEVLNYEDILSHVISTPSDSSVSFISPQLKNMEENNKENEKENNKAANIISNLSNSNNNNNNVNNDIIEIDSLSEKSSRKNKVIAIIPQVKKEKKKIKKIKKSKKKEENLNNFGIPNSSKTRKVKKKFPTKAKEKRRKKKNTLSVNNNNLKEKSRMEVNKNLEEEKEILNLIKEEDDNEFMNILELVENVDNQNNQDSTGFNDSFNMLMNTDIANPSNFDSVF